LDDHVPVWLIAERTHAPASVGVDLIPVVAAARAAFGLVGYGECPVYEIVLGRDGKGSFTHLGQDDVALLSAVLNRSGISSLKTSYQSEADGCTTVFTDQPSLSISVASGGKTRTVTLYHGCRGPAIPTEPLNWLADTIDFVANSRPLINGPQQ
jgi:hypothetical protein